METGKAGKVLNESMKKAEISIPQEVLDDAWKAAQELCIENKDMEIALLRQEVRGLKAMLNQYKRDYKKLLEENK